MASKVTFKKQPRLTGRMGVGHPYQIVDCKIKKQTFGVLDAPTWQTKDHKWAVRIMIIKPEPDDNPNCNWKWITFRERHDNEESARAWIQENIDAIRQKYTLRFTDK